MAVRLILVLMAAAVVGCSSSGDGAAEGGVDARSSIDGAAEGGATVEAGGDVAAESGATLEAGGDVAVDGAGPDHVPYHPDSSLEYPCPERVLDRGFDIDNDHDLDRAAGYTEMTGTLEVEFSQVTDLDGLECLTSIGALNISDNDSLRSLVGLDNLISIAGINSYVRVTNRIVRNHALENLDALSNLQSAASSLFIVDNRSLVSIRGLSDLHSMSPVHQLFKAEVVVRNNDALTSLDGLIGLASTRNLKLHITANDALENLEGLSEFTSLASLVIDGNDSITDMSGLGRLSSAGGIYITGNAALSSLDGLTRLTSVESHLVIDKNPELPTCQAERLVEQLTQKPHTVIICENLEDACGSEPCE